RVRRLKVLLSKVLLFYYRLKLIAGKLCSRWDGPFVFTNMFPYGVVELRDKVNNRNFKVNGTRFHISEVVTL
ncbi:hypothetical protein CR513_34671, partial [Mucuna pruriens]